MTERKIQIALYRHAYYRGHRWFAPNIYHFSQQWESDLISVTQAGFTHEYEIKCVKSDYEADFQKSRRRRFNHKNPETRHEWLLSSAVNRPNYFWFVMPTDMVPCKEIPSHAGLIYCSERRGRVVLDEIKKAPRLHDKKMEEKKYAEIGKKMMYRFWRMLAENPQLLINFDDNA